MSLACTPNLGHAPLALAAWLLDQNYPQCARERIVEHVQCHGTLAGLVELQWLDREDEATASEVFVEALPAVPQTASEWEDPDTWEISDPDERDALEAAELERITDLADAPTPGEERWLTLMWSGLPPIAGGAPEYTDADRRDFEAWLDQVDDYPPADQVSPEELAQLAAHGCV
jgi:hypothetical protein